MTGKELKKLVSKIPDDAPVLVDGADYGGYDICSCTAVQLFDEVGEYRLYGFDTTNYKFNERRHELLREGLRLVGEIGMVPNKED